MNSATREPTEQSDPPSLSIVTASFNSRPWIDLSWQCTKTLNTKSNFEWLVIQNTPEVSREKDISTDDDRFRVFEGPHCTPEESQNIGWGSFHHAKALSIGYWHAKADVVLVVDPDFFILYPDWISHAIQHIHENEIAFWGAPYPPRRLRAYRNFPMASCMFINRKLLHENYFFNMDFSPDCDGQKKSTLAHSVISSNRVLKSLIHKLLGRKTVWANNCSHIIIAYLLNKFRHLGVDTEGDTGCKIYREFHNKIASDCLAMDSQVRMSRFETCIDFFLPNSFRLQPRGSLHPQLIQNSFFYPYRDILDEYFFEDDLYGIHIGATSYSNKSHLLKTFAEEILPSFFESSRHEPVQFAT